MRFAIALAAALAVGSAANAAVIVTSTVGGAPLAAQDPGPLAGQTILIDWEAAPPVGAVTGNFQLVTGSVSGQYAAPAGNTTQYISVPRSLQDTPLSATVDLVAFGISPYLRSFSLYWGSIDTYNAITFLDSAMNVVFTLGGAGVPLANPNGDQGNQASNKRVNFDFGAGANVRYITLSSSQFAFESDDWAFAVVPEPATWAMLIAGFGMVGFAMRRRKGFATTAA